MIFGRSTPRSRSFCGALSSKLEGILARSRCGAGGGRARSPTTKLVGPTRRHDPLYFRGLRLCPVFPRTWGRLSCTTSQRATRCGLPAHLGKAHNAPRRLVSASGIAFARAGKGEASSSPPKEAPDHVYACGEGALGAEHLRLAVRSPLRARGRLLRRPRQRSPVRITPACAGKSLSLSRQEVSMNNLENRD